MTPEMTVSPSSGSDKLPPHHNKSILIHRLARDIETARENGALFFLAEHLNVLWEKYRKINGRATATELEVLIAVAAGAMVSE